MPRAEERKCGRNTYIHRYKREPNQVYYMPRAGITVLSQDFPMPSNAQSQVYYYVHTVVKSLSDFKCIRNPASSLSVPIDTYKLRKGRAGRTVMKFIYT